MTINIDQLTEAELIDLNHRIVQRLRMMRQVHAHVQMMEFKIGDRVSFQPAGRPAIVGMLTRYNKKTVTVITEQGQRWNVSPALLQRVANKDKEFVATKVILPDG
jgi:hypothetical protein